MCKELAYRHFQDYDVKSRLDYLICTMFHSLATVAFCFLVFLFECSSSFYVQGFQLYKRTTGGDQGRTSNDERMHTSPPLWGISGRAAPLPDRFSDAQRRQWSREHTVVGLKRVAREAPD